MDDKAQLESTSAMVTAAVTKAMRDMEGLGKKTKETEGIIGSLKSTLIGPLGLTAVLYGVSKAIESVAEESVQLQAFARNAGFASEGVEGMQQAMRRMGQSTQEANQAISTIGSKLQNLGVFKEYSQVWQDLVKFPGGVEFANRLKGLAVAGVQAGDQMAAFNEIIKTFNEQSPQTKIALSQTFGVAISTLEDYAAASKRGIHTWEINAQEAKKYHNIWVDYEIQFDNIFKRVANHGIEAANELTKAFSQQGVTAEGIAEKLNHGIDYAIAGIKHNIEDVKVMVEDFKRIAKFIEDVRTGVALPYPKGEDPMGRDYTRGYKDTGPGRIRLSNEDHSVLEDIWKTLQQIAYGTGEGGGVVNGSGGSGDSANFGKGIRGGAAQGSLGGFRPNRRAGGMSSADDQVGAGLSGSEFVAARRARFAEEAKDPKLRERLMAMMSSEGTPQMSLESLANRQDYMGRSLSAGLTPAFYGPMRNGIFEQHLAKIRGNPALREQYDRMIDNVLIKGSNEIGGRTDQGMPSDPNGMWGYGTSAWMKPKGSGNVFTDFGGGPGGHAGAAKYRQMIERGVAGEVVKDRDRVDHAQSQSGGGAFGKISASVEFLNVPNGVRTKASTAGNVFDQLNIGRTKQAGTYEPPPSNFNERFTGAPPGYE